MSNSCPVGNCPIRLVSTRFVFRLPAFVILTAFLGLGWSSYAFVSLQTGAAPLHWANPNVSFIINDVADPKISDESDVTAVRLAFQQWDEVPSSSISFFEDISAGQRARTDWGSDDSHLVLWDTNNQSGFFGPGSGLVAITPVDFNTLTGQIIDADVLFNAKDHNFSTSFEAGRFDIQSIATHEVGHFMGFDHSGVVASTGGARSSSATAASASRYESSGESSSELSVSESPASANGSGSGGAREGDDSDAGHSGTGLSSSPNSKTDASLGAVGGVSPGGSGSGSATSASRTSSRTSKGISGRCSPQGASNSSSSKTRWG